MNSADQEILLPIAYGSILLVGIVTDAVTPTSTSERSRNLAEWSQVGMSAR